MSRRSIILIGIAVTVLLAALAAYFYFAASSGQGAADKETFKEEYALTFKDYSGNEVKLSDYRRRALIAYAWASWCPYCGAEIQNLSSLKQKYGEEIDILAVNRAEPLQVAKAYTDALQNTVGVIFLLDPTDAFFKQIGGYAMPETVFIDEKGNVTFHQRGPIDIDAVEANIKRLLGQ